MFTDVVLVQMNRAKSAAKSANKTAKIAKKSRFFMV